MEDRTEKVVFQSFFVKRFSLPARSIFPRAPSLLRARGDAPQAQLYHAM
jgi:hypothetical protein